MVGQYTFQLRPYPRGIHLITQEVLDQVSLPEQGVLHLFIQHTSAGLTLNENADPSVRADMEESLDRLAPEHEPYYTHTLEGPDDMPAHIKSTLTGHAVSIPISQGKLNLGTWQGIYLCEFRDRGGSRTLVATVLS